MQNYIFWLFSVLCFPLVYGQMGLYGDLMLNSSLALAGVDLHFETGILRTQVEQAEVLFFNTNKKRMK